MDSGELRYTNMAVVRKIGKLSNKLLKNNIPRICIARGASNEGGEFDDEEFRKFWDMKKPAAVKEYMPGYYPRNEEERRKAAEKYGMHPDEYKPYPNDHRYTGDYPDLPWIGVAAKDIYYPWDYPAMKRNFEDPIHQNMDMMGEDRYDYGVRKLVGDNQGLFYCIVTLAICFILHEIAPETSQQRMEKQVPFTGVHYTFEPRE
nr:NADH dehydrogenase [ubiquinone] 1 beta subcomplex subunit 8, mitochondrial [Osmia lignaria]